jgi:TPR repeat protein
MNENDRFRAELLFQIGGCLAFPKYGNPDHVGASLYMRQASKLGYAFSSYYLYVQYYKGIGFDRNIPEAMKWLKLSAEQGCPSGMAVYGWHLLNAIYVESHQQNGLDYIQRAADLNDSFGLFWLGNVRLRAIHSYEDKE